MTIRDNIRRLLEESGHDEAWLAAECGVVESAVKRWTGNGAPSTSAIYGIRDAFGCTWDDLMGDEPPSDGRIARRRRKLDLLRFIKDFMDEHGWSPSAREMAEGIGHSSPSGIPGLLRRLERDGLIVTGKGARTIRLTEKGRQVADEDGQPLL